MNNTSNQAISDIMAMIVILKEKAVDDTRLLLLINSDVELVKKISKALLQDGSKYYLMTHSASRNFIISSLRDEANLIIQEHNINIGERSL